MRSQQQGARHARDTRPQRPVLPPAATSGPFPLVILYAYALSRHSRCEPDILSESLEVATSIKITHVDVLSTLIVSPSQSTQQHEFRSIRKSILLWYRLVCVAHDANHSAEFITAVPHPRGFYRKIPSTSRMYLFYIHGFGVM